MLRSSSTTLAALALFVPVAAQSTIVVQGGHEAFRDALNQAVAGDVLVVRPGQYGGHAVIDEAITVLLDQGALLVADGTRGAGLGIGSIAAGQTVRIRGGGIAGSALPVPSLTIVDCAGSVVLEDFGISSGPWIQNADSVLVNRCRIYGAVVEDSTATFSGCSGTGPYCQGSNCGALTIRHSEVGIHGCQFSGADPYFFFPASPAIRAFSSQLVVTGTSSTVIESGAGPETAIHAEGGSIDLGDQVTLIAGGPNPITGSAVVQVRSIPSISAAGVVSGQTFTANCYSQPGSSSHTLLSLPLPHPPVPTPFGSLWISTDALILDSGITPATGVRTASLTVPPIAVGVPVVLQPFTTLTDGSLVFGPPTGVVLN